MRTLILTISAILFFSSFAYAGEIAIVDREKLVSEALVFKSVGKQIDNKRIKLQKEFSSKEERLRKKDAELQHKRSVLSEGANEKNDEEFRKEVLEVQKDVANKRTELETMYTRAMKKMHDKVREISQGIAKSEDFSLVLFLVKDAQVLYSDQKVDISDKVLLELNKTMPDLKVDDLN